MVVEIEKPSSRIQCQMNEMIRMNRMNRINHTFHSEKLRGKAIFSNPPKARNFMQYII